MNTTEINNLLRHIKCFKGTFCRDELPNNKFKKPFSIIANTDTCQEPGQHWVAMYFDKDNTGFYFDSFGLPPLQPEFINFMNKKNSNGWTCNKSTLQSVTSSTCGLYCILFVKYKCTNSSSFFKLFTRNSQINDILIKSYTSL